MQPDTYPLRCSAISSTINCAMRERLAFFMSTITTPEASTTVIHPMAVIQDRFMIRFKSSDLTPNELENAAAQFDAAFAKLPEMAQGLIVTSCSNDSSVGQPNYLTVELAQRDYSHVIEFDFHTRTLSIAAADPSLMFRTGEPYSMIFEAYAEIAMTEILTLLDVSLLAGAWQNPDDQTSWNHIFNACDDVRKEMRKYAFETSVEEMLAKHIAAAAGRTARVEF